MTAREPFPRSPTPRPTSAFQIVTKRTSYQSLRSPTLMSPIRGRRFSIDPGSPGSPGWAHINVISPSTASHHSLYSDAEEDGFRSPRLALMTSNLLGAHSHAAATEINTLTSPSAPIQQPGDELLYNIATEIRPDERFFHPSFQAALNRTKQEMKDVSLAIWGCPAAHQLGTDLHALKQWAQNLSEFEPSRTKTIGLVGDSGVGKNSLINSLLDQPDLAHSNNGSSGCTCVVTEYRFRPAHHDEPFGMEVDYMTGEEIKELIEELLRSFREPRIPAFQDIDTVEDRKSIRERSEKAWRTLHSMFRQQPIFTKDFLLEYPVEADTPLINILQHWATEFLARRPGGAEARTWSSTAYDIDECTDKIDAFVRDPVDENTSALWPFVRVVRIYLRAAILQSGLVLVDCPSLRDLNYARVQATERYLRNCHEVFAVTTMDRALDDQSILDIIKRIGRHRPLRIICTKSEDINPRETERKEPDISLQVRTWRQQIEAVAKEVRRYEAQRRHGIPGALEEEVRSRDMLQGMEFGLKKFLIERKNCQIATKLIEKYADEVQLGDLKVFCVSNKEYFDHRYEEQSFAEPRLELSGVANLRKYCHSIPSEAQFAAAAAFIEHDVPAFLGSLRQWAVGGTDDINNEKAAEIKQLVQNLEEVAIKKLVLPSAQIQITRTNLNHEFASAIVLPIRENRTEWRNAALEASKEWTKWDAKTYSGFCRRYGNHETKTTGQRSWNEELIAPMRLQLQSNWGFFQESVEESKQELIDAVHDVFESICQPLREHIDAAPNALQNLLDNVSPRRDCIIRIIDAGFEDMIEGTSQIESDTLYGHASSYANALMLPAYQACNLEPAGPNADKNRKHTMATHITSIRLFPKLSTMIERHHRTFIRAAFDAMIGEITREVDNFVRDLHLVVSDEDDKSEAAKYPEFATRLRLRLIQADRALNDMAVAVEEVRRLESSNDGLEE